MNVGNLGFALTDGLSNHLGHLLISLPPAMGPAKRGNFAILYADQRLDVEHTAQQVLSLADAPTQIKVAKRIRRLDHMRDGDHIFYEVRDFVQPEARQRGTRRFEHHPALRKRSGTRVNYFKVDFRVGFL